MKIGIMQPYFFPYLGYWQLMNAVDRYVIYDDVNYIKGGYINRNSILLQKQAHNINLILSGASPNKLINQVNVNTQPLIQTKLLRTVEMAYSKAPFFHSVMPIVEEVITQKEENLAQYLFHSFEIITKYLGIETELVLSSELKKNCSLRGHQKVIAICKLLNGTEYYNSINGIPLYVPHCTDFSCAGIKLLFTQMHNVVYQQFSHAFIKNLSIIDVMMFNSQEECQRLLGEYDLIEGSAIEL